MSNFLNVFSILENLQKKTDCGMTSSTEDQDDNDMNPQNETNTLTYL